MKKDKYGEGYRLPDARIVDDCFDYLLNGVKKSDTSLNLFMMFFIMRYAEEEAKRKYEEIEDCAINAAVERELCVLDNVYADAISSAGGKYKSRSLIFAGENVCMDELRLLGAIYREKSKSSKFSKTHHILLLNNLKHKRLVDYKRGMFSDGTDDTWFLTDKAFVELERVSSEHRITKNDLDKLEINNNSLDAINSFLEA